MIALQFSDYGEPAENLVCRDIDPGSAAAPLKPGQVRLRLRFSPLHPSDLNLIQGVYGLRPELPAIPGGEASALVEAIGPGVDTLQPGDPVVLRTRIGAWRELAVVDAEDCFAVTRDLDLAQASMLVINPATAWRLLADFGDLRPGDWVLQNAANSAVGRCVIQIAKARGLRTVNLIRRESLIEELAAIGADAVLVDRADKDLGDQVREITADAPARLALNAVGGDSALRLMNWLAPGGTHVTYGAMGRRPLKVPNSLLIFKNLQLRGFWLTKWQERATRDEADAMLTTLADHMSAGRLSIPVEKVFAPHDCRAAIEAASSDQRSGKILFEFNA